MLELKDIIKDVIIIVNNIQKTVKTFVSGDASWAWVTAEEPKE